MPDPARYLLSRTWRAAPSFFDSTDSATGLRFDRRRHDRFDHVETALRASVLGLAWLGLIGAALTYLLWFRGLSRLEPTIIAPLGFLSPVTAIFLGWSILGQQASPATPVASPAR